MAHTYGQRPSTVARELLGVSLSWLTPDDWYALDLAATHVYYTTRRQAQEEALTSRLPSSPSTPPPPRGQASIQGENLLIRGSEVPPWAH